MKRRFKTMPWLLAVSLGCLVGFEVRADDPHTVDGSIEVGGLTRTYRVHVPPALPQDKPAPIVIVFHGGGGAGQGMDALSGFNALSDREGFLVAYPDGLYRNWNDGRDASVSRAHREKVDDLAFVAAMIDAIGKDHPIDPRRIFATGISNGGIFSHYLAANLSTRIAAIAPVAGGIADPFHERFRPEQPVSVLILQGTEDPLVPYHGGDIAKGRGKIVDTDEAVRKWVERDACAKEPATDEIPDKDPKDGCRAKRATWSKGRDGTEVTLVTIEGGGHTWPGGFQYLPERWIGRTCRDFDASEVIWEFFAKHPKPAAPAGEPAKATPAEGPANGPRVAPPLYTGEGADLIGAPLPDWPALDWLGGKPPAPADLRGKVVLIRFWTDTCSLCENTAPALNEFHERCRDRGLAVIGMYHPKPAPLPSGVPRDDGRAERVAAAARRLGFQFPIALDLEWKALNAFWLAKGKKSFTSVTLLLDRQGRLRHIHPGGEFHAGGGKEHEACEREYGQMKAWIEWLLKE